MKHSKGNSTSVPSSPRPIGVSRMSTNRPTRPPEPQGWAAWRAAHKRMDEGPTAVIPGHIRKDGTFVRPHIRRDPIPRTPRRLLASPPQPPVGQVQNFTTVRGHDQPSWLMKEAAPSVSCRNCYFFNWSKPGTCQAFPDGIPDEIAKGRYVHSAPYPGDNGTTFEHWSRKVEEEENSFPELPESTH
jgi:hypothetical protein